MKPSQGFTLIELMIVVAIVGVLAAVAIPSYQNYVAKSQAARVMAETGGLRAAVEVCVNESRLTLGAAVNQCEPGAVGSVLINGTSQTGAVLPAGSGVPQVVMPVGGIVTIESTFSATAVPLFSGLTLTWSRDLGGAWRCTTTIDPQYRPRGCE